jgi:hypothetical protein
MSEEIVSKDKNTGKFIRNVLLKGIALFLVINFAVALIPKGGSLGKISLYNLLFPGRMRLPFGENPEEAFNLSLYDLEAMFSSHEINSKDKPEDEFRVILIGDSATWGTLLTPEDTLSGQINQSGLQSCNGRDVRAFNLAYPSMSLTKDLMILEKALTYQPDLIIWPITLESFPDQVQIQTPLVANNPQRVEPLLEELNIDLDTQKAAFVRSSFWDHTLIGRRRAIFDALQLQFYGIMWAATGVDQTYPSNYAPAQRDFEDGDDQFKNFSPGELSTEQLAFDILSAGINLSGDVPVLIVNEPILISKGENSQIRYNFFYPRWAFDQYRETLSDLASDTDWKYIDLWDSIPQNEFTNSAVHLTPEGSRMFYQQLLPTLQEMICPQVVE